MNEPKSSRYHRLKRRAGVGSLICTAGLLMGLLWVRPALPLVPYVLLVVLLDALLTLPLAFYGGFVLEHRYELSTESFPRWLLDHVKGLAVVAPCAVVAAQFVYVLIARSPHWWWLITAVAGAAVTFVLAAVAPVLLLPLFYSFRPLDRPELVARLTRLTERAGVPVLGVFEWRMGDRTRRANAALVGWGRTRRILLSDTLLAEYSEDEIEVVLAHEVAHHVHRDIPRSIALEFGLLFVACGAASVALNAAWRPLGLYGPQDPAGLPLLALAAGAMMIATAPLVNAFSRSNERRADEFAVSMSGQHRAFVSAMRRLGAQNLVEESPSRTTVWFFHTHPPIEERIAAAQAMAPPV